jgi:MFS transporter, PPP family, 3-phenylpropionic acid transporter
MARMVRSGANGSLLAWGAVARPEVRPAIAVQGLFVLFGFGIAAFFPFLAIYLEGFHGLTGSQIGLIIAVMSVARLVMNPVWGHVADTQIGRRTALQLGAVGSAAGAFAMNLVDGPTALAAAAFIQSAFMVANGPNVDAIALVHLGDERMSDYGRIRSWESLTYAAGCLAFGAVLQASGVRWAMPIFGIATLLVFVWSFTGARDRPTKAVGHGRLGSVGAVFREAPRFWGFLAAVLLVWTGFNAAWNFIALKITAEGGGPLLIGIGTALGGLVEVPVMRSSSRLQRRLGLRKVYVLGCLVYATGFMLWGAISNPTLLSVLTVLEGVGFSLLFTTGVVIVGRLLPSTLYSTGNSVAQMVGFGIGPIVGAGAGGFVYQHLGAGVLYAGASLLALGAAAVAWFALSIPRLAEPGFVAESEEPPPTDVPMPGPDITS